MGSASGRRPRGAWRRLRTAAPGRWSTKCRGGPGTEPRRRPEVGTGSSSTRGRRLGTNGAASPVPFASLHLFGCTLREDGSATATLAPPGGGSVSSSALNSLADYWSRPRPGLLSGSTRGWRAVQPLSRGANKCAGPRGIEAEKGRIGVALLQLLGFVRKNPSV